MYSTQTGKVRHAVISRWEVAESNSDIAPNACRENDITLYHAIFMSGTRVVAPPKHGEQIPELLYQGYIGMIRMKGLGAGVYLVANYGPRDRNTIKYTLLHFKQKVVGKPPFLLLQNCLHIN